MQYDDIRPYTDEELPKVIEHLTAESDIEKMVNKYFPQMPMEALNAQLRQLQSIKQFQSEVISGIVEMVIHQTTDGLTFSGLENLKKDTAYLFMSNHRDIVLDSALINYLLNKEGYETARIAIGINLLSKPWITHLVKLNKSFIVKRDLPRNEMYEASMQLSSFILKSINEDNESVWIAQREGRSKDGNDRTQGGLINMLGMSKGGNMSAHFESLNIVPTAISYEYDPCDGMKLPELYAKANGEKYEKSAQEDYNSMKEGIKGKNGRIHISFGTPINSIPEIGDEFSKSDFINHLIDIIDKQIHTNYKLWPSNFMAADLIKGEQNYQAEYSEEQLSKFQERMAKAVAETDGDQDLLEKLFLEIYANPVINQKGN